jgi:glycine/sarcosine N-methyltransferase
VLDCACGIGTQALGLAVVGYQVHGTDLSGAAVRRAAAEARARGIDVTFGVADMRSLSEAVGGPFDVVISADNSLPHLDTDEDLHAALTAMRAVLRPGGLLLASTRDYDAVLTVTPRPSGELPRLLEQGGHRRMVAQTWTWLDAERYRFDHFILVEDGGGWTVRHRQATYRAITRSALSERLEEAGFTEVCWCLPEESGFFQPFVTARRR